MRTEMFTSTSAAMHCSLQSIGSLHTWSDNGQSWPLRPINCCLCLVHFPPL